MKRLLAASFAILVTVADPCAAQWLNQPTRGIPRTSMGEPDLTAPPSRAADGHVDLSGLWQTSRNLRFEGPESSLTAAAQALVRAREENYFKDRPSHQCRPTGPEVIAGWKRVIQTPMVIAILYDELTYRLIFMDGRSLEPNP